MGKKLKLYHSAAHPGAASVCVHKQRLRSFKHKLLLKTDFNLKNESLKLVGALLMKEIKE